MANSCLLIARVVEFFFVYIKTHRIFSFVIFEKYRENGQKTRAFSTSRNCKYVVGKMNVLSKFVLFQFYNDDEAKKYSTK